MAFLRNLFSRAAPQSPPAAKDDTPIALYLGGDGKMQAIKHDTGYLTASSAYRTNILHLLSHAEQYARAAIASVWAANCINLRADTLARLDWFVRDRRTQERIDNHPFEVALYQSRQNIIRKLEKSQLTHGETFIKPRSNDNGYNSEMWVLNNLYVEVDTARGFIAGFMYTPPGLSRMRYYQPHDLAYIYTDNEFDDLRGLSRFEHVMLEIGIDQQISRTTASFYKNDARPGLLLLPENDLTPERASEFTDYWNAQFKGPDKAGKLALVPSVIKDVKEIQRSPSVDDVQLRESTRREICAAFKVPLSMAGAWDDATYQSLPEQRKAFYEETVIPAAEAHAQALTRHALPFFETNAGTVEVYFDAAPILALIENTLEKVDIANRKLSSGAYSINEYRTALEDEPIRGGDIHLMQSGWIPVRQDELADFSAPNNEQAPPEPPVQSLMLPDGMGSGSDATKKREQPRDRLGRFGEGGGGGSSGGGGDGDGDSGGGGDKKPKKPKKPKPSEDKPKPTEGKPNWASAEQRNAGMVDGHLDYGHIESNPINGTGRMAAKEVARNHAANLSSEHKAAAQVYTSEAYKGINNGLRGKGELSAEQQRTIDQLDSALSQNSLDRPTVLYRGMKLNDDLRGQLTEGATFTDSAYTSTSLDQANPDRFDGAPETGAVMRIQAPAGQNGLAASELTEYPEEHEFILPRDTQYRITSVRRDPGTGQTYIDAEIVSGAA